MGQYWYLVNLDKREKIEFTKLGEGRRDFAIHSCLSGCKFTVSTATEYIERCMQAEEESRKLHEQHAAAVGKPSSPGRPKLYRRITQSQSSFMKKLPVEVISICVGFMETLLDKACFALTCQDAWDIARPTLIKQLRPYESWQGDRILCIGDYTRLDDVPPNVLNDEELATVSDMKTGKWRPSRVLDQKAPRLYLTDFLDARGMTPVSAPAYDVHDWLHDNRDGERHITYSRQSHDAWFKMVRETRLSGTSPAGTVLRNLTTHEFIRGDTLLAARRKNPDSETCSPIHFWGLADILLLRIAWAPDDGCYKEMMAQADSHGPWAGHRFDFVAADQLPRRKTRGRRRVLAPWKDVSNVLINELLCCYGW